MNDETRMTNDERMTKAEALTQPLHPAPKSFEFPHSFVIPGGLCP